MSLRVLKTMRALLVQHCIKRNHSYANNTYHVVSEARGTGAPIDVQRSMQSCGGAYNAPSLLKIIAKELQNHNIDPLLENYLTTLLLT